MKSQTIQARPISGRQVVILRSIDLSKSKTHRTISPVDVLRFLRGAISVAFSQTATIAVLCVTALVMWWHNITIDNPLEAQRAVGLSCLIALPWLIAMFFNVNTKKGGQK